MTHDFPKHIQEAAADAALLFAGAFEHPKVDAQRARETLSKLGIPTNGRVLVTFAYNGCKTHDFADLEKVATAKNAKLYVIYGNPNEPGLEKPENHSKLSIGVTEDGKPRNLKVEKIILAKEGSRVLSTDELKPLVNALGFTIKLENGISSGNGSAIFENGVFKEIITPPKSIRASYQERSSAARG